MNSHKSLPSPPHPLKSTLLADRIVASNSLFEQVPGDVKVRASLSELVDVPAQRCAGLILLLLFHVVVLTIVPLFEGFAGQPRVGLHLDVVGKDLRSDVGLVDHSCCLAPPGQWACWLVLAVASLLGRRLCSLFCNHFGIVFCNDLGHIVHRSVADLDVAGIKVASETIFLNLCIVLGN